MVSQMEREFLTSTTPCATTSGVGAENVRYSLVQQHKNGERELAA